MHKRVTAMLSISGLLLAACTSQDPLGTGGSSNGDNTIVIGTANFPESEIIGELWAAELTDAGFDVEMASGIGSREVYMQALEEGTVDIVPEYTGNLAEFLGADVQPGSSAEQIFDQVTTVLPSELVVGQPAPAESKDSYTVTKDFADEHKLSSIADLADLDSIVVAGNPEFAQRPYGPEGLSSIYGVDTADVDFTPISDGGGPLTVAALQAGDVDVADIYTTSPHLDSDGRSVDLVTLDDPKNLVPAQNVIPVFRAGDVPQDAIAALNEKNATLTTEDLLKMNERNIGAEKAEPGVIVRDFLDKD